VISDLELALVSLYARTTTDLDPEQLRQLGDELAATVIDLPPGEALGRAAREVPEQGTVDQFAAAQAFVLGVRFQSQLEEDLPELRYLGSTLASSVGAETQANTSEDLVGAVALMGPRRAIPPEAIALLSSALGPGLVVTEGPAPGQVQFSGPAARFAAMLVELAWNLLPRCRSRHDTVPVDGVPKEVTLVEVEVCTDLPFDRIRERIDPLNWPTYNPYFVSVTATNSTQAPDGWSGAIREVVGPGINGQTYVTDLNVRCVTRPELAAVAFDLTEPPGGDGRVTVDRGFLSVADEGARRRVRVLKVYRIEDLAVPHWWLCPLWAAQVALSGWWHS
jgi:hypothetical protein